MGDLKQHYEVVLSGLEAEREELDRAIALIKRKLGNSEVSAANGARSEVASDGTEIPRNAFTGMSMPAAIKAYLRAVNKKQNPKEVMKGLRQGGFHTTAKNLYSSVYTTLKRLETTGEVAKVENDWGLADWYPALRRERQKLAPGSTGDDSGDSEEG